MTFGGCTQFGDHFEVEHLALGPLAWLYEQYGATYDEFQYVGIMGNEQDLGQVGHVIGIYSYIY